MYRQNNLTTNLEKYIRTNTRKMTKVISTFMLVFLILGNPIYAQTEEQRLQEIQAQKNQANQTIDTLQGQIDGVQAQIYALNEKIITTNDKIEKLNFDIKTNEEELTRQYKYLDEYIRNIYIEGQTSEIELIATSSSISEYVDRSQYLLTMQQNIKDTTNKIISTKEKLLSDKQQVEVEKGQLESMKAQQIELKNGLVSQQYSQQAVINQLSTEEKALRKKMADRIKNGSGGTKPVSFCSGGGPVIAAPSPVYTFPVKCGYISQGWGYTAFATADNAYGGAIHNGIDVAVGEGTAIYSIGAGTVLNKGYFGTWGNTVSVLHPDGRVSFYAHMMDPAYVSIGQSVDTSTVIGAVGGTGGWPVHLHFSLYTSSSGVGNYPGSTLDPLNYMNIIVSTIGTDWDPSNAHY